jgi:D-alanyl-D-alanine carboxypeptidase (penicillin-binding protein 5/6)
VEQLFLGLMLRSGNDAANALARLGGGLRGRAGTIDDMNAEAHRLGAWDTHAETPSGLDGPGQVTSVYDLALIFRACFANENFRRYIHTQTASMPTGVAIANDNRLLYEYPGALGGKTGYTSIARHTYVGAAERNGRRLVATILGAEISPVRAWQQAAGLLDWGFATAPGTSVGRLVAPGDAEKLMAPPEPSPTPAVSTMAAIVAAPSGQSSQGTMLVLVGAGAAAIGGAWVLALRVTRRRRARHRRWRADDRAPALVGAGPAAESGEAEASPAPASTESAQPPVSAPHSSTVEPDDPITTEIPTVTGPAAAIATEGSGEPAAFPPPPGPGSWDPPATPPLMGQPRP